MFFVAAIFLAFCACIAWAPDDLAKIFLAIVWVLGGLSVVASCSAAFIR